VPPEPSEQKQAVCRPPSPTEVIALGLVEHADTGGHWYWLGDIYHEGIDPVPTLLWNRRPLPVIKLLLPAEKPAQVRHVNVCGLRTCVNPEHWKLVPQRPKDVVATNFDGKGWRKRG
jgi:hypothetical protein